MFLSHTQTNNIKGQEETLRDYGYVYGVGGGAGFTDVRACIYVCAYICICVLYV